MIRDLIHKYSEFWNYNVQGLDFGITLPNLLYTTFIVDGFVIFWISDGIFFWIRDLLNFLAGNWDMLKIFWETGYGTPIPPPLLEVSIFILRVSFGSMAELRSVLAVAFRGSNHRKYQNNVYKDQRKKGWRQLYQLKKYVRPIYPICWKTMFLWGVFPFSWLCGLIRTWTAVRAGFCCMVFFFRKKGKSD